MIQTESTDKLKEENAELRMKLDVYRNVIKNIMNKPNKSSLFQRIFKKFISN